MDDERDIKKVELRSGIYDKEYFRTVVIIERTYMTIRRECWTYDI